MGRTSGWCAVGGGGLSRGRGVSVAAMLALPYGLNSHGPSESLAAVVQYRELDHLNAASNTPS